MTDWRVQVVNEVKTWLGTPFHNDAMVRGQGVACGPLLISVYGTVGFKVPDYKSLPYFPIDWHLHCNDERYLDIIKLFMHEVDTPLPGDTVLFRLGKNRPFSHTAIVVDWPLVIHAIWNGQTEYAMADKAPLLKHNRTAIYLSPNL